MEKAEIARLIVWGTLIVTMTSFLSGWNNIANRHCGNWGWIIIASCAALISCLVVSFAAVALPTLILGTVIGGSESFLSYAIYLPTVAATYLVATFSRNNL
ncbi:MAG: hypothetical protein KGZ30_03505 [Anaplasmataceae bacterium]|nr:hypothetical protein [Anaplasmataceae bacterium]